MTAWVRHQSFQRRLTALVALAVGIAVALVACASYVVVDRQLNRLVDQRIVGYYSQIRQSASEYSQFGRTDPPLSVLHAAEQSQNVVEVVQQGGAPTVLYADDTTTRASPITPTAAERAVATQTIDGYHLDTNTSHGVHYRVLTMPVTYGPPGAGVLSSLIIATPLNPTLATLARLRLLLYVLLLGTVAVAIALGLLIARVTIRPVKRLTATAEYVAATQQLDATIDEESTDELGRLAHAFNEMLGALGASRRQQAQLVSDAGHELRTPLTSLRTNVELMMKAKQLPEADQRELYGDVSAQVEELTTLIGDLVELARQDEQQVEPVEVRLDSIVERAVQRARRRAPSLAFDVDLTSGSVRAHPPMLERAVLNVLDNAAKWSPPGGTVEVRLTRGAAWLLEVRDHGPGIAPEDESRVFDRFYRAPTARSMPGSGLGLAIVSQVVTTHGGRVSLGPAPGGGTLVRIGLPTVVEQEPALVLPPPPSAPPPVGPAPAPGDAGDRQPPAGVSGGRSGPATP